MSGTAAVAEHTGGSRETETGHPVPVRLASVYLPAPLPREGRLAFWDPDGDPLPAGPAAAAQELTVVRRHGAGVRRRQVPALTLPLAEALPLLVRARRDPAAHPATACWGAAALHALRLVARGRLLPGLTPAGHDAWRAGPLEPDDIAHLRAIAAALPPEGHAVPLPGSGPPGRAPPRPPRRTRAARPGRSASAPSRP
ncbi:ATP-dependent helicase, partial [Streptomyces tricolor]